MPCPRCRAAEPPDGRFCAQCGQPLPAASPVPGTTRRQMTVLFCDLADSTGLAQRIDPDDLLVALQAYHDFVCRTAARFGGFVARIVGDGVDIYFGYPLANEDDAARGLHTALVLAAEVPRIEVAPGVPLALRIGVATGVVAVSAGQGIVAGATPNLAARIQCVVPVGAIGVSQGTRRIAGAQFEFEDAGTWRLKGFDAPVPISVLRRARALDSRSAWRGRDASLPMIGRAVEMAALLDQWNRALTGRICGAFVVGEPGIGKSRLVTALDHALPAQGHTLLRLQCSPFHAEATLHPFAQHLAAAAGLASGDTLAAQADKLDAQLAVAGVDDPGDRALAAALLGMPAGAGHPAPTVPPALQLRLTLDLLRRYVVGLARERPLLVIFEDMHWADPTSQELVGLVLAMESAHAVLFLMTARPGFRSPWEGCDGFTELRLQRLPDADARAVAAQQSRCAALPPAWLATIVERTDGVPLFIEEMTRMLVEDRSAGARAIAGSVPDTLTDLLTERLDRLPPGGKLAAQLASVIGREFDRALLAAAVPDGVADLDAGVRAMLDEGLVLAASADGARMLFKHALVEDTAYASMSPRRRAELHGRIAHALLTRFRDRVELEPALAARHLTRAGDGLQAAVWWHAAGEQALARGAPREAAGHLRAGIGALDSAPPGSERDAAELGLLSMLGPTTMVLTGPGSNDFGAVQERAHALSCSLPGQPRLFPISYGWCLFNWARTRLVAAARLADGLLGTAARHPGDPETAMAAHNMAGMVCFHRGDAREAEIHLAQSTALYEPERDAALYPVYLMDFGVFGRFYRALSAQVLGCSDEARRLAAEALALAESLNQPHTLGFALLAGFNTAVLRGDAARALPLAEHCIDFSGRFGFPEFVAMARIARGWARAHGEQQWTDGLVDVQAGIAGWVATGFENWQPWFAALEAEILDRLGRHADALRQIDFQLARIGANGERQFESPLLAERAVALTALGNRSAAAAGFDKAEALARRQGAVAWLERIARRRRDASGDAAAA